MTTHEIEVLQHLVHNCGLETSTTSFARAMRQLKANGYVIQKRRQYVVTDAGKAALRKEAKH